MEEEIFKRANINIEKLLKYGFKKEKQNYVYEQIFLDNEFKAIITIDFNGTVRGKVIDLQYNEEYINIRTEMSGQFISKVRNEYKSILKDIKNKCFDSNKFIFSQTNRINNYLKEKYNSNPEFLWSKFPGYAIYRNENNKKWYGIIMNLDLSKLDKKSGEVEIINVKLAEHKIKELLKQEGYYEAYHMNKSDWISIILNDTIKDEDIQALVDESYNLINEPEEWIIPANPKYYDIVNCFNDTDEIIWKESSNIHINDILYLYVAAPYSKIMYKCKAIEVNIPYEYKDNNISMKYVMKIKLLKKFNNKNYSFEYLNELGIKAIRGPRKISKKVSCKLK